MKSTQRPSKPPKQQPKNNEPSPKPELVAYKPVEKPQEIYQPTLNDEQPQAQVIADQPQLLEKGKSHAHDGLLPAVGDRKSDSGTQSNQHQYTPRNHEEELPPQNCQHIQFLDCDKPVGRIIFECYHCQQGIISEFAGEPVMGEYKGYPSLIEVKIQCPNCEQTAIRLTTGEVLSTTAIPSPWQQ
ncbi:hypothetical protein VB735_32235 [Halotia wernerae UHCC 0503]|nr:hypothetical protein [Halotia wernerae UHCC 0503]